MTRARSFFAILGAVALLPIGFVAARIAEAVIVEPLEESLKDDLIRRIVGDLERRGRLHAYPIDDFGVRQITPREFVINGDAGGWKGVSGSCNHFGRIVPYFEGGVQHGFSVVSLSPRSVFSRFGIEPGDTIRRINGRELNSPHKALEIFTELRGAKRIEVELDRWGERVRNGYRIE